MARPRRAARTAGSTTELTQRLSNQGIHLNHARSTALFQLATEIPARNLDIHTDVAVAWQRLRRRLGAIRGRSQPAAGKDRSRPASNK
ncbi:hypothetical protein [Streptomyces durbertensis]|uniref:hypothetical protein n=1 Tax=Streptomyces durbertensis TaxID=2448886 RepID=UPI001E2E81C5|nr:hypothetical protein [Streptomyces durbertensis]